MTQAAINITGLSFTRGRHVILEDVDIRIDEGAIVAIMGPSGVGKTTLLRMIAGQLLPETGKVEVWGQDTRNMSHRELYEFRRHTGVLLQNGALFTDMTVFENVATPIREHTDLPEPLVQRLVLTKLHAVGLRGAAELMPAELSGGMARRVALARAVVLDPRLVLYDEPLAGLDPIATNTVNRLIREANDALGSTSVIVTHNVEEMSQLVDYCYILADKGVVGKGRPETLLESEDPSVRQFMQGLTDGPVPFHYPAPDLSQDFLRQGNRK